MRTNASEGRLFAWVSLLALVLIAHHGCTKGEFEDPPNIDDDRVFEQEELDFLVEYGLDATMPVITTEQLELHRLTQYRRQIAENIRVEVQSAVAPIAMVASLFAMEGVADVVLAIAPVHKLSRIHELLRTGRKLRKQKKTEQQLKKLADEVSEITGHRLEKLIELGQSLNKVQRKALLKIRADTDSAKVAHRLMARHFEGKADLPWIAKQLGDGPIDKDFVRRFSFDTDLVREYTLYSANPSWKTLQEIATRSTSVAQKTRDSLASKITGLLGEQAAAGMIRSPGFRRRFFNDQPFDISLARGVGYGGNRSIDIVASGRDRLVFAEVKNWSFVTWADSAQRNKVLEQLQRHNEGIDEMMIGKTLSSQPSRLLMVRKEGYQAIDETIRKRFEKDLQKLGWVMERMPDHHIPDFSDLLDGVK